MRSLRSTNLIKQTRGWALAVIPLAALIAVLLLGCDAIPQPQPVATFFPPTAVIPTVNSSTPGGARASSTGKSPTVVLVTLGTLAQTIQTRGRVSSVREMFLYFPLRGAINKINVDNKGQSVIAVFGSARVSSIDGWGLLNDRVTVVASSATAPA